MKGIAARFFRAGAASTSTPTRAAGDPRTIDGHCEARAPAGRAVTLSDARSAAAVETMEPKVAYRLPRPIGTMASAKP
jgi:hypothetical protein